ncbi:hypothetical protein Tco_1155849 [Tanacetum coccineum]
MPVVEKNYDSEDAMCAKKKRKGNKQENNMMVAYKAEAKVVEVKSKTNDRKTLNSRMSPRNLKRVLDSLTTAQQKRLKQMGFGEFEGNFDFYYVPGILALWVVRNFNPKTCTLVMEDGIKSLKEKNLFDPVTVKWRGMVEEIVSHDNKINISQLESFLCTLSEADWLFDIGFLSLFFSIFAQGNKDITINERLIPYLDETDKIHQMDWCSYVLESLVKECTGFSASDKFSGPVLLLVVKVEKTVPAFKAWSSNLLVKRQQEELDLKGVGVWTFYPIIKGRNLMEDTDNKLDTALAINSDDEELKNIIEKRNELFVTLYKDNEELRNIIEKRNELYGMLVDAQMGIMIDKVREIDGHIDNKDDDDKLESEKISDPSLGVHQVIEDMTKFPFISRALKEAAHDVPPVDERPSFNKLK